VVGSVEFCVDSMQRRYAEEARVTPYLGRAGRRCAVATGQADNGRGPARPCAGSGAPWRLFWRYRDGDRPGEVYLECHNPPLGRVVHPEITREVSSSRRSAAPV
jgi:hypothetical protein